MKKILLLLAFTLTMFFPSYSHADDSGWTNVLEVTFLQHDVSAYGWQLIAKFADGQTKWILSENDPNKLENMKFLYAALLTAFSNDKQVWYKYSGSILQGVAVK